MQGQADGRCLQGERGGRRHWIGKGIRSVIVRIIIERLAERIPDVV
jgi:hypothetical protein